jgi:hypothetical protein
MARDVFVNLRMNSSSFSSPGFYIPDYAKNHWLVTEANFRDGLVKYSLVSRDGFKLAPGAAAAGIIRVQGAFLFPFTNGVGGEIVLGADSAVPTVVRWRCAEEPMQTAFHHVREDAEKVGERSDAMLRFLRAVLPDRTR